MRPGIYEHYKGGRYTVLMTAFNSTNSGDREELVVYVSHTTGGVFVRDLCEFGSRVEVGGTLVERFKFVGSYERPVRP